MNWQIYGHLPFTCAAAGCVGWGNYPAATALALVSVCFTLSGIAFILAKKATP